MCFKQLSSRKGGLGDGCLLPGSLNFQFLWVQAIIIVNASNEHITQYHVNCGESVGAWECIAATRRIQQADFLQPLGGFPRHRFTQGPRMLACCSRFFGALRVAFFDSLAASRRVLVLHASEMSFCGPMRCHCFLCFLSPRSSEQGHVKCRDPIAETRGLVAQGTAGHPKHRCHSRNLAFAPKPCKRIEGQLDLIIYG